MFDLGRLMGAPVNRFADELDDYMQWLLVSHDKCDDAGETDPDADMNCHMLIWFASIELYKRVQMCQLSLVRTKLFHSNGIYKTWTKWRETVPIVEPIQLLL